MHPAVVGEGHEHGMNWERGCSGRQTNNTESKLAIKQNQSFENKKNSKNERKWNVCCRHTAPTGLSRRGLADVFRAIPLWCNHWDFGIIVKGFCGRAAGSAVAGDRPPMSNLVIFNLVPFFVSRAGINVRSSRRIWQKEAESAARTEIIGENVFRNWIKLCSLLFEVVWQLPSIPCRSSIWSIAMLLIPTCWYTPLTPVLVFTAVTWTTILL